MHRYRLNVAEARIVHGPAILETILGSCVAAVFWHPRLQIGAMCHGALPLCPPHLLRGIDIPQGLRYVDYAMRYLIGRLKTEGVDPSELELKLFGGANVLATASANPVDTIGFKNAQTARLIIAEEGLRLVASDLGGSVGRVIYFRTDSGEVFLRRLKGSELPREELNS